MNTEVWKDIKDYEGIYQISNYGRVKNSITDLIRSPFLHKGKYHKLTLF